MKYIFGLFALILISCQQNPKIENPEISKEDSSEILEVLLVGTFHFANYNPENNGDVVQIKIRDVLTKENQIELEKITNAIFNFNPNKIFVEFPYKQQNKLDSLFTSFEQNADYDSKKRNELYQLGFRAAKKLKHNKIYGIDLRTDFPFDSLFTEMRKAKQFDLIKKDELELEKIENSENELFKSDKSLTEIIFYYNDSKRRRDDINWYLSLANQGGELNNFVGSYLTSEWYRRNLHMYSIIQRSIEKKDKRVMILAGASHIAMFKDFIDYNPELKTIELKEIMNK